MTIVSGAATHRRRMFLVLGGLVGAGIMIGIVAAALTSGSSSPAGTSAAGAAGSAGSDRGAGSASDAVLAAGAAEVAVPPPPAPAPEAPTPPPPPVEAAGSAADGSGKLEAVRASLETKAIPKLNAFEAAMRDKDLKQAKAELDGLANVTSYPKLRERYETAEDAAIQDLTARLERVKGGDCREYNLIVEQDRTSKPPRVAAEATRQIKCTPAGPLPSAKKAPAGNDLLRPKPPKCDAEALAEKGKEQFALSQLGAALASLEAAWNCRQDPSFAEKAFVTACNIRNLGKAKLFWRRISVTMKQRAVMICVRNGITEQQLNAP